MNLSKYLQQEKISVQEFAKLTGLTRMCIYNIINKKAPPHKSTVKLIELETKGHVTLEDLIYTRRAKPKKLDPKQ